MTYLKTVQAGQVVQTQILNSNFNANTVINPTLAEVSSNYRLSITPRYSNSLIKLEYYGIASCVGSYYPGNVIRFNAIRIVSGSAYNITSAGSVYGSRPGMAGNVLRMLSGTDSNDGLPMIITGYDAPNTTSTISYGFQMSSEHSAGGTTYMFGITGLDSSTAGGVVNTIIIAQEIKQ